MEADNNHYTPDEDFTPEDKHAAPFELGHILYFESRFVRPEDAHAAGFKSVSCEYWESLKLKIPHLPHPGGAKGGVTGLGVLYPRTVDRKPHFRIRPDQDHYIVDSIDGRGDRVDFTSRWLTNGGVDAVPFIPPQLRAQLKMEREVKTPIFFVESPVKALALYHAGLYAIGLGGVEAGGHDPHEATPTIHPELSIIDWQGRPAIILFDAGIVSNAGVARGAARLAMALKGIGADARIVYLPLRSYLGRSIEDVRADPDRDQGPDDYLAEHGPEALHGLIYTAQLADPVDRMREIVNSPGDKADKSARASELLRELYFQACLKLGGDLVVDAVATITKSLGIGKRAVGSQVKSFDSRVRTTKTTDEAEWMSKLRRHQTGGVISFIDNAITVLSHDPQWAGVLAWDEFQLGIVMRKPPPWSEELAQKHEADALWTDVDDVRLRDHLARVYGINLGPETAYSAALVVAHQTKVHPVREALDALKWDGTARLDTWLPDLIATEPSTYAKLVGRYFLLQMINRIYRPGCKADYVLVLESPQGFDKSNLIHHLLPNPAWFADSPFTIGSKDGFTALRGKAVLELAELVTLMRAESNAAKAFFTSAVDHYRPPYAKRDVDVPRSCTFAGTINGEGTGLFRDRTGNRRYWPIHVEKPIDVPAFLRVRDQLLAEAVHRYKAGERYWPTREEEAEHFVIEQEQRREEHPWLGQIIEGLKEFNETTIAFVLGAVLDIAVDKQRQLEANLVATLLKDIGFAVHVSKAKDETGKRKSVRVYRRLEPIVDARPFDPAWTSKADANLLSTVDTMTADEIAAKMEPEEPVQH